jgi:hypothetical protein
MLGTVASIIAIACVVNEGTVPCTCTAETAPISSESATLLLNANVIAFTYCNVV